MDMRPRRQQLHVNCAHRQPPIYSQRGRQFGCPLRGSSVHEQAIFAVKDIRRGIRRPNLTRDGSGKE